MALMGAVEQPPDISAEQYFHAASVLDDGTPEHVPDAMNAYRRALEVDPYLVPALINLANLHYSRDDAVEAQALYERAIALEPHVFEAHFNLGNIFHDLGRYTEAQGCYREAIRLNPAYAEAHFYLAVTLEKGGRSQDARAHWRAYQQLAPDGRVGASGEGVLGLGYGRPLAGTRPVARASSPVVAVEPACVIQGCNRYSPARSVRSPLLRHAAQLVVLAVAAPRLGIEAGRARVRLHLAVGAELGAAGFGRLLPAAGLEPLRGGRQRRASWPRAGTAASAGTSGGGVAEVDVLIEVGCQRLSPARAARAFLPAPPASTRCPWPSTGRFGRRGARRLPAYRAPRN